MRRHFEQVVGINPVDGGDGGQIIESLFDGWRADVSGGWWFIIIEANRSACVPGDLLAKD